jgi:CelD/BcsL family acetyltransferase involved in cellulose biosynthesis
MRVTLGSDDIAGLEPEWNSLLARDPTATPFSSFQWAHAWCRHWSEGASPWVLEAREGDRLVGLAAFVLHRRGRLRLLRGLGVGVGNYWDILAAPDDRENVQVAIGGWLCDRDSDWDALFVDKLPEESTTVAALRSAGLRTGWRAESSSPRIELPATFEDYLAGLSKNRRGKLRRNLRALDSGEMAVSEVRDPDHLRQAIDRWQALRIAWWAGREQPLQPEHASDRFLAFTQEVIPALLAAGHAAVWEVRYRDELLGITINFLDDATFYYWLWGFDVRFEELRPGHTLIAYCIRWSIDTGRRYFDFMIGDEPYKYDYAPAQRSVRAVAIGNSRLRSRAVVGISGAKHTVLQACERRLFA